MKKFKSKVYNSFVDFLLTLETKDHNYKWSNIQFKSIERAVDYWRGLSYADKKRLVSDSRWNHYPLVSYTPNSPKRFGSVINSIVDSIIVGNSIKDKDILCKSSEGVFAVYSLDKFPSIKRLRMSKRLSDSPDVRIRTRCAKILPVHYLGSMINDKAYSVRNAAISRIGLDNCYKDFLPTDLRQVSPSVNHDVWCQIWLQRSAVKLSTTEELKVLASSLKGMDYSELRKGYATELLVSDLIRKLPKEDLLYLFNLFGHSSHIDSAFKEKIGSDT